LVPKGGTNTAVLFSSEGARTKEPLRRTTPSSITTAASASTSTTIAASSSYSYHYEAESKLGSRNSKWQPRSSLFIYCSLLINYNDPPIYRDGGRWRFSPKPLVVILFRAPGGRGIYKKPLEPTQRPTNSYMGWATPPTPPPRRARRRSPSR
jgi:hypothetical protein